MPCCIATHISSVTPIEASKGESLNVPLAGNFLVYMFKDSPLLAGLMHIGT
jgi:hypothetical protein